MLFRSGGLIQTHVAQGSIDTSDLANGALLYITLSRNTRATRANPPENDRLDTSSRCLLLKRSRLDSTAHRNHPANRHAHSHLGPRGPETHFQTTLLPASIAAPRIHQNRIRLRKASDSQICRRALRKLRWKAKMHPVQWNDAFGILWRSSGAGLQVARRLVRECSGRGETARKIWRRYRGSAEEDEDAVRALQADQRLGC